MMAEYKYTAEDLRASYAAIVDYHNNLVQIRFTTAGLALAGNGFLASGYFQPEVSSCGELMISIFGLILVILVCIIEFRTNILLINFGERGKLIEEKMSLDPNFGFFDLLNKQVINPKPKFLKRVLSHRKGIISLYLVIGVFWVIFIFLPIITK